MLVNSNKNRADSSQLEAQINHQDEIQIASSAIIQADQPRIWPEKKLNNMLNNISKLLNNHKTKIKLLLWVVLILKRFKKWKMQEGLNKNSNNLTFQPRKIKKDKMWVILTHKVTNRDQDHQHLLQTKVTQQHHLRSNNNKWSSSQMSTNHLWQPISTVAESKKWYYKTNKINNKYKHKIGFKDKHNSLWRNSCSFLIARRSQTLQ